jgi:FtsH-binding integral membrane protein
MKTLLVSLLTVLMGLLVGFLLSGHAAEAGVEQILIRLALVCGGIALIAVVLRRGSR